MNEWIGQVLKEYGLEVTIMEDRPYIGIIRGYKNHNQEEGLIELTKMLKADGVEKIIYDFSKIESSCPYEWILEFDKTIDKKIHIEARYIGLRTKELNPKLLDKQYSFQKNIAETLEYAVRH
jgi:hypothetical protein